MGSIFTNAFGLLTSIALMAWVVWVAFTSSPMERLERTCAPATWMGKAGTSIAMLADDSERSVGPVRDAFVRMNYGCKFTLWRVFYEDDWKRAQAAESAEREALDARARQRPDHKPPPSDQRPGITQP
jgi:hypothetical protein